jgi:chromosome segregation ATPase
MTDEELVKRLRSYAKDQGGWHNIDDTCEEAADRIEALTEVRDTMGHLWAKEAADKQVALGRIEALTEQLEAARADAKEAEAYAEELQGDLTELCRQLIATEDKLATCEKYRDAYAACDRIGTQAYRELEGNLAKAVRGLNAIYVWGEDTYARDMARTTLAEIDAEIKRSKMDISKGGDDAATVESMGFV